MQSFFKNSLVKTSSGRRGTRAYATGNVLEERRFTDIPCCRKQETWAHIHSHIVIAFLILVWDWRTAIAAKYQFGYRDLRLDKTRNPRLSNWKTLDDLWSCSSCSSPNSLLTALGSVDKKLNSILSRFRQCLGFWLKIFI